MPPSVHDEHIQLLGKKNNAKAVYTPWLLHIYDWLVLSVTNNFAWKCSTTKTMLPLLQSAMGEKHMDVGVGTGYFPAKAIAAGSRCKRITLVDLSPSSLAAAKARIAAESAPQSIEINEVVADAMQPLPLPASEKFDSISMFYLIHCIPGPAEKKIQVFDVARQRLAANGTLVGATVLGRSRPMNWLAWILMNNHNRVGIFDNWNDTEDIFAEGLRRNFDEVEVWVEGRSLLFTARKPRVY